MATDIAFALGVLASLGDRVPLGLKVFVAALAIVDDIIAVLVIAIFYSGQIRFVSLAIGFAAILASFVGNLLGIRKPIFYALIGVAAWGAILDSGVHATIAGVLLAFTIPARTYIEKEEFLQGSRSLLDRLEVTPLHSADEHAAIHTLQQQCELAESPLHRIEHALQPWVSFFVMPLFAFANAGVQVIGKIGAATENPIALGVFVGLVLGKPLGITLFSFIAAKTNLAVPPAAIPWSKIFGASLVCGIGFTMSLFIATLAFGEGEGLDMAKVGILAASLVSASVGAFFLGRGTRTVPSRPA
jgi:NhaA family Na+:H+ antiporter